MILKEIQFQMPSVAILLKVLQTKTNNRLRYNTDEKLTYLRYRHGQKSYNVITNVITYSFNKDPKL